MDSEKTDRLRNDTETVLVIDTTTFLKLRGQIASCEACRPGAAEVSAEMILDAITGSDPTCTTYFMLITLRCPKCNAPIADDGLVEWEWDGGG